MAWGLIMPKIFHDFDLANFWSDSDCARESYVEGMPTAKLIASIEKELGVRLPTSYLELMDTQNGGIPRDCCFPTKVPTSWAQNHVAISGISGIGRKKLHSLCGGLGSKFMQDEWGYPDTGICICDCPSAGHDMIMLDFRKCGSQGEPEVVHVDQERDYQITFLAKSFETFIRGLVNESVYDTSASDLKNDLAKIDKGSFSTPLARLISGCSELDFGPILRNVCRKLTMDKGCFALDADELSRLVYDIQFYLSSVSNRLKSKAAFLEEYPTIIALGDGEFCTGGYALDFVDDWLIDRLSRGEIISTPAGLLVFSNEFLRALRRKLREFE
jgi:hypothetical protein